MYRRRGNEKRRPSQRLLIDIAQFTNYLLLKLDRTAILVMFKFKSLVFLCFPAAIVASPAAERYAPNAPFGLYGYGDGIGGASVFTSGGKLLFTTAEMD